MEEIIRSHGIAFEFAESLGGANGVSEAGKIQVLQSLSAAQKFSTMCLELAHELLHRGDRRTTTTKAARETEAESVAFVVCRANGLDCSTRASDYIRLWDGDEKVLMQSLEQEISRRHASHENNGGQVRTKRLMPLVLTNSLIIRSRTFHALSARDQCFRVSLRLRQSEEELPAAIPQTSSPEVLISRWSNAFPPFFATSSIP